jgi:hypothetical protein
MCVLHTQPNSGLKEKEVRTKQVNKETTKRKKEVGLLSEETKNTGKNEDHAENDNNNWIVYY